MCSDNLEYMFGMINNKYLTLFEVFHVTRKLMEMVWKEGPFIIPNNFTKFQKGGGMVVRNKRDKKDPYHK